MTVRRLTRLAVLATTALATVSLHALPAQAASAKVCSTPSANDAALCEQVAAIGLGFMQVNVATNINTVVRADSFRALSNGRVWTAPVSFTSEGQRYSGTMTVGYYASSGKYVVKAKTTGSRATASGGSVSLSSEAASGPFSRGASSMSVTAARREVVKDSSGRITKVSGSRYGVSGVPASGTWSVSGKAANCSGSDSLPCSGAYTTQQSAFTLARTGDLTFSLRHQQPSGVGPVQTQNVRLVRGSTGNVQIVSAPPAAPSMTAPTGGYNNDIACTRTADGKGVTYTYSLTFTGRFFMYSYSDANGDTLRTQSAFGYDGQPGTKTINYSETIANVGEGKGYAGQTGYAATRISYSPPGKNDPYYNKSLSGSFTYPDC